MGEGAAAGAGVVVAGLVSVLGADGAVLSEPAAGTAGGAALSEGADFGA